MKIRLLFAAAMAAVISVACASSDKAEAAATEGYEALVDEENPTQGSWVTTEDTEQVVEEVAEEVAVEEVAQESVEEAPAHRGVIVYNGTQHINIKNPKRVTVIDFNATWCGPCRYFGPIFDEVAEKYAGKADFYSVDIDKYPELFNPFHQQGIPYIVILGPRGVISDQLGALDKPEFEAMVAAALGQ